MLSMPDGIGWKRTRDAAVRKRRPWGDVEGKVAVGLASKPAGGQSDFRRLALHVGFRAMQENGGLSGGECVPDR